MSVQLAPVFFAVILLAIFYFITTLNNSNRKRVQITEDIDKILTREDNKNVLKLGNAAKLAVQPLPNCLRSLVQCTEQKECFICEKSTPTVQFSCEDNICVPKRAEKPDDPDDGNASIFDTKEQCYPEVGVYPVFRVSSTFNKKFWSCLSTYPEVYSENGKPVDNLCGKNEKKGFFVPAYSSENAIINPYISSRCDCASPYTSLKFPGMLPTCSINVEFYKNV